MPGDLTLAARYLLTVPLGARWRAARDLMARADAADRYRRRFGRAHPDWGNGTLRAAAAKRDLPPEPRVDDPVYCDCLILVLEALRNRRGQAEAQEMQRVTVGSSSSLLTAMASPQSSQ
ncbi:MAG: hypothetical protein QNJ09_06525 [Paracoccaceae bacterium]|nr:hypothetical protein [Paracoccaceae bacterium]